MQLRAAMPDGEAITVSGALTGRSQVEKLVEVNGRHFDLRAEGEVIVLEYADRPGVMGRVGSLLGEAAVNIEAAQISQTTDGTDAIMLLRVDRRRRPGRARADRRVHRGADDAARLVRLTSHHRGSPARRTTRPDYHGRVAAAVHASSQGVACGSAGLRRISACVELIEVQRGTRACALRSSRATASGRRSSTRR